MRALLHNFSLFLKFPFKIGQNQTYVDISRVHMGGGGGGGGVEGRGC